MSLIGHIEDLAVRTAVEFKTKPTKSANETITGNWNFTGELSVGGNSVWHAGNLVNPITGTGTSGYIPKFTGTTTQANSNIFDDGTNVGIGTTTPATKLSLGLGASVAGFATYNTVDQAGFNLYANSLDNYNRYYDISAVGSSDGFEGGSNIRFLTSSNSDLSNTALARMIIKENGNVGIGTTAPGILLAIGAPGTGFYGSGTALNAYVSSGMIGSLQSNGNVSLGGTNAGTTPVLQILGTGNVGIGYSTGTEITNNKLAVNGSGYFNGSITTEAGSGSAYSSQLHTELNYPSVDTYLDSKGGAAWNGRIKFRTSSNGGSLFDIMIINSSGVVEIPSTTASTSTTTGALTVGGGLGVGGQVSAANAMFTTGAAANTIATGDASGNLSWSSVNSAIGGNALTADMLTQWDGSKLVSADIIGGDSGTSGISVTVSSNKYNIRLAYPSMTVATPVLTDTIAFYDASALYHRSCTFTNIKTLLNVVNYTQGDGITITSGVIAHDISTLTLATPAANGSDYISIYNATDKKTQLNTIGGLALYNAINLQSKPISTVAPATDQVLKWNGTWWIPTTISTVTFKISTGITAPTGTPLTVGDMYVNTSGKKVYVATGTTNYNDWTILN